MQVGPFHFRGFWGCDARPGNDIGWWYRCIIRLSCPPPFLLTSSPFCPSNGCIFLFLLLPPSSFLIHIFCLFCCQKSPSHSTYSTLSSLMCGTCTSTYVRVCTYTAVVGSVLYYCRRCGEIGKLCLAFHFSYSDLASLLPPKPEQRHGMGGERLNFPFLHFLVIDHGFFFSALLPRLFSVSGLSLLLWLRCNQLFFSKNPLSSSISS